MGKILQYNTNGAVKSVQGRESDFKKGGICHAVACHIPCSSPEGPLQDGTTEFQ